MSVHPWSGAGAKAEAHAIASGAAVRRPPLGFHQPRDIVVGYTIRAAAPASYVASRRMENADPLTAVTVILEDLAIPPEVLIVRRVQCAGPVLAIMLAPRGCTARVVAIIREGLSDDDLNTALFRLTPGCAA